MAKAKAVYMTNGAIIYCYKMTINKRNRDSVLCFNALQLRLSQISALFVSLKINKKICILIEQGILKYGKIK
jgi:hypothetical protein